VVNSGVRFLLPQLAGIFNHWRERGRSLTALLSSETREWNFVSNTSLPHPMKVNEVKTSGADGT